MEEDLPVHWVVTGDIYLPGSCAGSKHLAEGRLCAVLWMLRSWGCSVPRKLVYDGFP